MRVAALPARLRRGLPFALLLAALVVLFPAFVDSGPLHEPRHSLHHVTYNHLAVAKNLAAEHAWLGFYRQIVDDGGETTYEAYNRFPPLGYFLIKLAMLTQPDDLAGEIQAARMLMLALYAGAAVLAYLSVATLTGQRYVALAATLTAFSSYGVLHACDMVATEGTVDLFGTMLVFHGIAHYRRAAAAGGKPRLGQLVAKTGAALLLGWHVLALLALFVAHGLAAAVVGRDWAACRRLAAFGALALLFGIAVLTYNLAREYLALADVAMWDLPSLESMRKRSILDGAQDRWPHLGLDQLHRVGLTLAPYLVTGIDLGWRGWTALGALAVAGIAVAAVIALSRGLVPRARSACLALVPLATAGLLWAVVMHGSMRTHRCFHCLPWTTPRLLTWDTYEAMFHVGMPLAVFALLSLLPLPAVWRRCRASALRRVIAVAAVALVCLAFVGSALAMGQRHRDPGIVPQQRALLADLAAIRRLAAGERVFVAGPIWQSDTYSARPRGRKRYYFTDSVVILRSERARFADFAAGPRIPGAKTLTPGNQFYFLYAMDEYNRVCAAPPADAPVQLRRWCRNL